MRWAAVLHRDDAGALGALRLRRGVEVCEADERIYLRGQALDDEIALDLRKLPGARRFSVISGDRLVPVGARVPTDRFPDGPWTVLAEYLSLRGQVAALPGETPERVTIRVVRSRHLRSANLIVTDLATWHAYVTCAPEVRLKPLAFAVASDRRVVVQGLPLPPVRGVAMVAEHGVAVPCGYHWEPPVDAEVIRAGFDVTAEDLVLLWPTDATEIVRQACFVAAGRSAVRLTRREHADA